MECFAGNVASFSLTHPLSETKASAGSICINYRAVQCFYSKLRHSHHGVYQEIPLGIGISQIKNPKKHLRDGSVKGQKEEMVVSNSSDKSSPILEWQHFSDLKTEVSRMCVLVEL
jgi:hypothetical protein